MPLRKSSTYNSSTYYSSTYYSSYLAGLQAVVGRVFDPNPNPNPSPNPYPHPDPNPDLHAVVALVGRVLDLVGDQHLVRVRSG